MVEKYVDAKIMEAVAFVSIVEKDADAKFVEAVAFVSMDEKKNVNCVHIALIKREQ